MSENGEITETITEDFPKEFETNYTGRQRYSRVTNSDKVVRNPLCHRAWESRGRKCQRTFGAGWVHFKLNLTIK